MHRLPRIASAATLVIAAAACSTASPDDSAAPSTFTDAPIDDDLDAKLAGGPRVTPASAPSPPDLASPSLSDRSTGKTVPVLLFHQMCAVSCPSDATYGTTILELARILAMFASEGYETISIAQYAAFVKGHDVRLPARPVLVTFDDGRRDAWQGATDELLRAKARAVMYVITAGPGSPDPKFMSWSEVEAMAASGAWDIQLHAHAGHTYTQVGVDANGAPELRHAYAWRRYLPETGELEPFEAWRARFATDIVQGNALLAAHVPGYVPHTFAVPFGDYGQFHSNDARIASAIRSELDAGFVAWFTQPDPEPAFTKPGGAPEKSRYTVEKKTTAEDVRTWLRRRRPITGSSP